jgi:hypothetical protein
VLSAALLLLTLTANARQAVAIDARTGQPIPQAEFVIDGQAQHADAEGRVTLPPGTQQLQARAIGYGRATAADASTELVRLPLAPLRVNAVYLSPYGIGDATLRGAALKLAAETEIDALVVDVKGDRSIVPFPSAAYEAAGIGTQTPITVRDMRALATDLHQRGLYLIARVVIFKDDRLAGAHPQWAVHTPDGTVWHDREELAWIDPFRREAWDFALSVAEEAARLGFDEIQFDYLRFPDAAGLVFSRPDTEEERVAAINGFLDAARARLAPYNVFVSADVFGYICWNLNDTQIGQQLEAILPHVDYLSPMLYPSGFTFGIPEHRDPVAAPYDIVHHSLARALQRTGASPLRLRPWLQAFRDYAFDRRNFDADEVRAQIDGAEALGVDGWMLWNPHNRYEAGGLKAEPKATP